MTSMTHTMEPEVSAAAREMPAKNHAVSYDAHPLPTEDQITRVVFYVIMAASVLFIAATLFVSHM
jgi:hypothetical protein